MYKVANFRLNKLREGEGEMLDSLGEIIRMIMGVIVMILGVALPWIVIMIVIVSMKYNNWRPESVFRLVNSRQFFVKDKKFQQK